MAGGHRRRAREERAREPDSGEPNGAVIQANAAWSALPDSPQAPNGQIFPLAEGVLRRRRPAQPSVSPARPAPQVSVTNNASFSVAGALGGAGGYISWTGTVTARIGNVAGIPYTGSYSVYGGSMAAMASNFAPTNWTNPALTALGAPYADVGLGVFAGTLDTTAVETIGYAFSSPIPSGQSFELVDPGATYVEYSGVETYTISATYQNAAVSMSGWSFAIVTPTGATPTSTIAINAAAGTITVTSYSGATWPDSIVIITPNSPVSTLTVTANTIPYDFWALTLPHLPSALIFQSVDTTPSQADLVATWQVDGAAVDGGGAIANPGPDWTYEGTGDFQGNGGTDILFESQAGQIVYWAVSGTTIFSSVTLGYPGANWQIVGLGDFNNNGLTDILFEDSAGDLALWEISTAAIVGGGLISNPGAGWSYIATADFNGNGCSDLLFENASGVYAVWLMRGTSIASSVTLGAAPAGCVFAGVGNFNGDNKADILFENPALGQYTAWLMSASGGVASTVTLCTPGVDYTLVSIGAYTTSSTSDLIFQNTITGANYDYVINGATLTSSGLIGAAGPNWAVSVAPYALPTPPAPTILFGDANGDIAEWGVPLGVIQSGAFFASPGGGWSYLTAGDFDGAGQPDILFTNASGSYALWETDRSQIVNSGVIGGPGGSWQYQGVGDFNGDGIQDLLFVNSAGLYATWLLNGPTVIGGGALGTPGSGYTLAGIADLTGDGTSDLLFLGPSGTYFAWFVANDTHAGTVAIGSPGAGWSLVGTADFNGDGKTDLLFQNSAGSYETWDMSGASVIGGGAFNGPGPGWNYFGVADLNDSRDASILFENASTNQLIAYNMNDATVASVSVIGTPGAVWTPLKVI